MNPAAPNLTRRPFHSVTADFAAGRDTARAYLERCLERIAELEPQIGAFVASISGARAAADRATARWRDRQAAVADRRHAGRHQGHHGNRGHADRAGLAALRAATAPAATPRPSRRCARPAPSSSARP